MAYFCLSPRPQGNAEFRFIKDWNNGDAAVYYRYVR